MTDLMPSTTNVFQAALAVMQSASDLFGTGSPTFQAIGQALAAVGLSRPAAN